MSVSQSAHLKPKGKIINAIIDNKIIKPVFITSSTSSLQTIKLFTGQNAVDIQSLIIHIESLLEKGFKSFCLFEICSDRDPYGNFAFSSSSILPSAISKIRKYLPEVSCVVDLCLCQYTSHGHCGILTKNSLDNNLSSNIIKKLCLKYAESGCEIFMPSSMLDGLVTTIRQELDLSGFKNAVIISQGAKFDSAFYGPFRKEAHDKNSFLQTKSDYQLSCSNYSQALYELIEDAHEGADMVIIKPALTNLDLIQDIKSMLSIPVGAFITSGEYKLYNTNLVPRVLEAGVDFVVSY